MIGLKTPGVYIREVEVATPVRLRMDITGFVGMAERGPVNYPQVINGWGEYLEVFGGFVGFGYLPYSVFAFFANGGERCYVVRVAHDSAHQAGITLVDKHENPLIQVEAINKGVWGNDVEVGVAETSTDDLILTELENSINAGEDTVAFKSVSGLFASDDERSADSVTLVNRLNPALQERMLIKHIDFDKNEVTFHEPVSRDFPAGSSVLGKGFKLIFRYYLNGRFVRGEVFDNLSMEEIHPRYFVHVINGDPEEEDYIERLREGSSILVRVKNLCAGGSDVCSRIRNATARLEDGGDGKPNELEVHHYTGYQDRNYYPPNPNLDTDKLVGLARLETVGEIGLVCIPDLIIADLFELIKRKSIPIADEGIIFTDIPQKDIELINLKTGQADMLFHSQKMGDRFAILDSPPGSEIGQGENKIEDWPNNFQSQPGAKYGAMYYPWIKQKASDFEGRELFIPAGGHVAGVYARSEQVRGIGKAPANEILRGVVELELCLSDAEQAALNPRGVNCLRILPGRGIRIWGARALSLDPLSRYVNIRRVTLAVIKNILLNMRPLIFEPNDRNLRRTISTTLNTFFLGLFQSGVLAGSTPDEAFSIKCDEENNPPEVVDSGRVITDVRFAPARPAEFILVTIIRSADSLSVSEQS